MRQASDAATPPGAKDRRSRALIHLADAEQAAMAGRWADAIGHCLAANAAGAATAEVTPILRSALEDGRRQRLDAPLQDRACFLAIEATANATEATQATLDEFVTANAGALVDAATSITDDLDALSRRFDRLAATGVQSGLAEEQARRRAAIEILPALDALVERNPSGWQARARRASALLDLQRFRAAIADLRYLAKIDLPDPFVHTNLITYLRRLSHPEVVAAVGALMAVMPQKPEEFERWGHALIGMNATQQGFALFDKLIPHKPEYAIIKHLRTMAEDLDLKPVRQFGRAPSGRPLLYAAAACWGAKRLASMNRVALASLLAPGNFPALCARHDVALDLFTMADDLERASAMPSLQALASHCQIRLFVFPSGTADHQAHFDAFADQFLGFAAVSTMRRAARDGADMLFLSPELVYADDSFAYVASIVTKAPRALMADRLSAAAEPMLTALEPFRSSTDPSLAISIQDLVDLAAPRLLATTADTIFDPAADQAHGHPQQVIFREADGLIVHRFHRPPAYLSHAALKLLGAWGHGAIDSSVSQAALDALTREELLPQDGELRFLRIELAEAGARASAKVPKSLIDSIRNLFLNHGFHSRSLEEFMIGVRYPVKVALPYRSTSPAQREAFLAALAEDRRTHPIYTELCVERDKHSRAVQQETTS